MLFDHMPKGTFLKVDSVSLDDMSKEAAISRISFRQRNTGLYTAIVAGNLVACAHISEELLPRVQDELSQSVNEANGDIRG